MQWEKIQKKLKKVFPSEIAAAMGESGAGGNSTKESRGRMGGGGGGGGERRREGE